MSCIRSCYDKDSSNFGHDDCPTCIHKDASPQRTWEGLSVFEINDLVENTEYEDYRGLVEAAEAKLKEKNT